MGEHHIRLLATDFDGTIFRYGNESHLYAAFAEQIRALQASGGRWIVCSGRSLRNLRAASRRMLRSNIKPDYILVRYWLVLTEVGGLWLPNLPLTLELYFRRRDEVYRLRVLISHLTQAIHEAVDRCRIVHVERFHLRAQFRNDEDMKTALRVIENATRPADFVMTSQHGREIDIRYIPFPKAVAVETVRDRNNIPATDVLAVGDGRSDQGMMVNRVAHMTGCPSNARRDTTQFVMNRGGHVARRESLGGTIDVINAYLQDQVCSDPPEGWHGPTEGLGIPENPSPQASSHGEKNLEIVMIVGTAVAGVLALASFGIIPYGYLLLKPIFFIVDKIAKLFS